MVRVKKNVVWKSMLVRVGSSGGSAWRQVVSTISASPSHQIVNRYVEVRSLGDCCCRIDRVVTCEWVCFRLKYFVLQVFDSNILRTFLFVFGYNLDENL